MKRMAFGLSSSVVLVSGCTTLGPDYASPELDLPAVVSGLETGEGELFQVGGVYDAEWWLQFDDPVLEGLIEAATQQNTDLRVALARLEAARTVVDATAGQRLPRIGARTDGQRLESSTTAGGLGPPPGAPSVQNLFELGVTASWEVDVFGRIARRIEASAANAEAVQADVDGLILVLQAETAAGYLQLRSLQDQLQVARDAEALSRQTVDLTGILAERDLSSEFDLVRVRAELQETVARQERLIGAQRATIARLALLTGVTPDKLMNDLLRPQAVTTSLPTIPVGLPSDLVRRRPDVQAAERRLAAATAEIGAETADLFPRFNLTGGLGFLSADADDLFDDESLNWSLGGFVTWPIFDGGASRAEIRIAEASAQAALATYDGAVIAAFSDVEGRALDLCLCGTRDTSFKPRTR